jgi:hypothetical protein
MNTKKNFFILFLLNFNIIYLEENNLRAYSSTGLGEEPFSQVVEKQEENNLKSHHFSGTGEVSHQQIVESQKAVMEAAKLDTIEGALDEAIQQVEAKGALYQALVKQFATIPAGTRNSEFRSFVVNGKVIDFNNEGENVFKNVAIKDFLLFDDLAGIAGDLIVYPDRAELTFPVLFVDSENGNIITGGTLDIGGDFKVYGDRFMVDATSGDTVIEGTLDVTGATTLSSTLGVTGNTTIAGTLGVTGAVDLDSSLNVDGATTLVGNTTLLDTLDVTKATTLLDTLGVTGATTLSDTLDVTKATTLLDTLDVTKATTLSDTLDVTKATTLLDTLDVTKATTLLDTLDVTKATTLSDTLDVTGATTLSDTLDVTKATTLLDTLDVTKATTLLDTLDVTGATTLSGLRATGAVDLDSSLNVDGATTLVGNTTVGGTLGVTEATTLSSTLDVTGATTLRGLTAGASGLGNTTVGGTLGVTEATTLSSTLDVTGATTLTGLTAGASALGNTTVGGTLGVTGATTLSSTLGVTGNTTLTGLTAGASALGNTTVGGTLGVTGATTLSSTLRVTGDVTCVNDFTVFNQTLGESIIEIDNSAKNITIDADAFDINSNTLEINCDDIESISSTSLVINSPSIEINTGALGANSTINIGRRTSTIEVEGDVIFHDSLTLNGPLNVEGAGLLNVNNLEVGSGNLTVNTNKFVVAGPTGDTTVAGVLTANNGFIANDIANFNWTVTMAGPVSINTGSSTYNTTIGSNSNYVYINGRTQFGGPMTFNEPVTMTDTVTVTGTVNLPNTVSVNFGGTVNPGMTDYSCLIQASDANKNLKFATYNSIWDLFQREIPGAASGSIDTSDYVLVMNSGETEIQKIQISNLPGDISSRRYKENIEEIDLSNDIIDLLSCYSFNYIPTIKKGRKAYGFIAEELINTPLDFAITYDGNGDIEGIDYNSLFVALFSVYKNKMNSQDEDMKKLQKENSSLKKKLDSVSNELNVIKKFFNDFCDKKFSY